ncbi:hypothetical protein V8Z69_00875 [Microbacterium aurugineum]|uniref:hypothetical protein n=1 Tax=Microbacterium aurugineum TaxID=2851642 RepID=UPI0039BE2867
MTDSSWTPADDARAAISGYGPEEPLLTALAFLEGLGRELPPSEMAITVTPESLDSWGDFSEAKLALDSIDDWGLGSYPEPSPTAPDVAYVKILAGVTEVYQVKHAALVRPAAWLSLVWRPEHGFWLVHAFGHPVEPERMPRTSPGEAPHYTRAS